MEYPFPNAVKDSLLRSILSYGKSDQLRESNCQGYRLQSEDPLCADGFFVWAHNTTLASQRISNPKADFSPSLRQLE